MHRKKFLLMLVLALALALGVVTVAAQGTIDGSGWWSGYTIQNISGGDITALFQAYWETDGDPTVYSGNVDLPNNYSVTFNPGLDGNCDDTSPIINGCRIDFTSPGPLPSDFEGSVVVSSEGEVAAVVQVNNNPIGSVGVAGGTARSGYQGTSQSVADTTLIFPTVKVDFAGQSTTFFVQASSADANVQITYTMNDGNTYNDSKTIKANRMYAFIPAAAGVPSCNGGNGSQCIGGATVVSTNSVDIAGAVVEYETGASVAKFVLATRGLTPGADTGTRVIAPTMKNDFYGGTTGASVYNYGNSQATVDLEFSITNVDNASCGVSVGDTRTDQITVPAKGSRVVSPFQNNIGGIPDCAFFSMTASTAGQGGQPIAVTVNETQSPAGVPPRKAVYFGFPQSAATGTVFAPLIKESFVGNAGSMTLVNASATESTKITVTYVGASTHVVRTKATLGPGEAVPLRQLSDPSSPNRNFVDLVSGGWPASNQKYAVTAQADNGSAVIVGLIQEAGLAGNVTDVYNVEGLNQ